MRGVSRADRLRLRLLRIASAVRPPRPLPAAPRSILIIRPDHLGDAILAAPALSALRAALPGARLTAWAGPAVEAVWRHVPALDSLEVCDFPGFTRRPKGSALAPYAQAGREAARLRGHFDVVLNPRADFWWGAMVACWAGIPVLGYATPECSPFLSLALPFDPGVHETDRGLRLVQALTGAAAARLPAICWPAATLPADVPTDAVVLHVGSGAAVKLWDETRWAHLAQALQAEGCTVVLNAGSRDEAAAARRIEAQVPTGIRVASNLSLEQLASFYRASRLVIAADNGPLHMARSVGTPTVALFGPTDPDQFGPEGQPDPLHEVVQLPWPCVPCRRLDYTPAELPYHLCVRLIEPERVLQAARRVLAAQAARSS
ncbi:MAG: glycosyltransferase family 9 protein [Chloroflexi bacterium]|nr:glycosyltransferase family 9 protein [Chloroflexota bacterium]